MRENELANYYSMLGLTTQASRDEIEEAYAKLSRKYAQLLETNVGLVTEKEKAEVDFEIITMAYNALVDEKSRQLYDSLLPDGVKTWDDRFRKDKNVCTWWGAQSASAEIEGRSRKGTNSSITRKTFGTRRKDQTLGSFDRPEILRPVSQMIRSRQSFWQRIKRFIFGW